MVIFTILCILFYLGVECGASWPWSDRWQDGWKRRVPEFAISLILAGIANTAYGIEGWLAPFVFIVTAAIIFAGVESATWMFLQWDKDKQEHTKGRTSTTKPLVDKIARKFGYKLGDEGYSWTASTVKGTIITLPAGGLGGLFFAFGYEVGSHAPKFVKFNPKVISEGLSYALVGAYYFGFLTLCKMVM